MAPELRHAVQFTIRRVTFGEHVATYELLRHAARQDVLDLVALLRRQHPEAQISLGVDTISVYK